MREACDLGERGVLSRVVVIRIATDERVVRTFDRRRTA
jgi:hypothetical protein